MHIRKFDFDYFNNYFKKLNGYLDDIVKDPNNFISYDYSTINYPKNSIEYNLEMNDDGYVFEMPMPGITEKDVSIQFIDHKLCLKFSNESKWFKESEIEYEFNNDANVKKTKASLKNGIFKLIIPFKKNSKVDIKFT